MLFSVVIPTYKRQQALGECLNCLAHYFDPGVQELLGRGIEVIVTDDGHDDSIKKFLARRYPWCSYTQGPQRGPAPNRNHGARQASGEWIVFTDDDCLPQPGWIEAYAEFTHLYDLLEGRTSADGARTRVDEECPINETGGYLWSCNFAIRRELYFQLGGFNEHFPEAAMEDVELNRRINKAGLRRLFLPMADVKHPWRSRKGLGFLRAKARSIATYVRLHPETARSFSLPALLLNLLRSCKATLSTCLAIGSVRGLARQVALDTFASFATWRAVRGAH